MNAPEKFALHNPDAADPRHDPTRVIRAPRGSTLNCKSWLTEAPFRMLQNNLDAEVAERPQDLVVYGGTGPLCSMPQAMARLSSSPTWRRMATAESRNTW